MEVMDKTRSRSSTSCLKVGLCDGTACQHSLMIMYLKHIEAEAFRLFSCLVHLMCSWMVDGLSLRFSLLSFQLNKDLTVEYKHKVL